jgi:putative ABC transport system permease protein
VRRNLGRRPLRTLLTVLGVGSAMLLFVLVESLSAGLDAALSGSQAARTLIVYRKNRYCPQTSFLPERYTRLIADVPGVASVLPVKVFLSNCRASLDMVAFQGAPVAEMLRTRKLDVVEGDVARFEREHDAALVGREFASRRGLSPGDRFKLGGIDVNVAGVFRSDETIEEGLVLTHLEFLQRAGPVDKLGTVTQFEVVIDDPARAQEIAREIDARLATAEEPTDTRPELAFLEGATRDLREILRFGRFLALACVAVVLVLVANTVVMSRLDKVAVYPKSHFVTSRDRTRQAAETIKHELEWYRSRLESEGKLLEAQRLHQRTMFDLEMIKEMGFCRGIENYSRHLTGKNPGEPPPTLLDYLPRAYYNRIIRHYIILALEIFK